MTKIKNRFKCSNYTEKIALLLKELFPICRSLTGNGNRETLNILGKLVALNIHEVPSGKRCYDWKIPKEWNVREAWIKDANGQKIVDFQKNNLSLLNYSVPVHVFLKYDEIIKHIHTLPKYPDAIPYRTSYYEENWGFCLSYSKVRKLDKKTTYEVYIDSNLDPHGSLTYADAIKKGKSGKEYLISTYCCHPALANDNLSGLVLAVLLFKRIQENPTHHTYRLVIVPETIGAIAYLHEHEKEMKSVSGGYVITSVAGPGEFGYKESFMHNHEIDLAAKLALRNYKFISYPFSPIGSDERQYSSPGFRIPVGTICKSKYYEYDEYHTSMDNLDFISVDNLRQTLEIYWQTLMNLEMNRVYLRESSCCEFMLGKHGLCPSIGGWQQQKVFLEKECRLKQKSCGNLSSAGDEIAAMSWLMFGCDGKTSLLHFSERSKIDIATLFNAAKKMEEKKLLKEVFNI